METKDITKYILQTNTKQYYCKVRYYSEPKNYTLSFGGKNTYCIIIAYKLNKPEEVYIDRIEYDEACVKDGTLEHGVNVIQFVSSSLWTTKTLFPNIKKIYFKDDSHIYCKKGSKQYKLNLAYDYILKYNKTWYEENFKAELEPSFNEEYKRSLLILDEELDSFDFQVERGPYLKKYEDIYKLSSSPRDFIYRLRKIYMKDYCIELGKWLTSYLNLLKVSIFSQSWYIRTEKIDIPENYSIIETMDEIRGGSRRGMGNTRRRKNFHLCSYQDYSIIG